MYGKWNQIGLLLVMGMVLGLGSGWSPAAEEKLEPGFARIFNGKDMTGWDGAPRLWKVVDGAIRGQTTPENPTKGNTFCLWRGGRLKNFVLKIKIAVCQKMRTVKSRILYVLYDLLDHTGYCFHIFQ